MYSVLHIGDVRERVPVRRHLDVTEQPEHDCGVRPMLQEVGRAAVPFP